MVESLHRAVAHCSSRFTPELVQDINETILCDSDCLLVCVFEQTVRLSHVLRWPRKLCISQRARASEAQCLRLLCPHTHAYCYWHVHSARSELRRGTKHHQESQDPLQSCSRTHRHITKRFSISAGVSLSYLPNPSASGRVWHKVNFLSGV